VFKINLAQQLAIGEWGIHLNYSHINDIIETEEEIFVATKSSLFSYDREDYSIRKFSKLDGLSSMNVSAIAHDDLSNYLIVGYENGDIDFLKNNQVVNIPHVEMANILGEKSINHIFIDNNLAYLSCAFGLVILDIQKLEIKETCYFTNEGINLEVFGSYVFDHSVYTPGDTFLSNKIFVGTNNGLFYTDKNNDLFNPTVWENDSRISFSEGNNNLIMEIGNTSITHINGIDLNENGGKRLTIGTDIDYSKVVVPWSNGSKWNFFEFNTVAYIEPNSPSLNLFQVNSEVPGSIIDVNYNTITNNVVTITDDNFTQKIIVLESCGDDCFDPNWLKSILSFNSSDINGETNTTNLTSVLIPEDYSVSNQLFLGDYKSGLIIGKHENFGITTLDILIPNGPSDISGGAMSNNKEILMFTHGGKNSSWNNTYNYEEISLFKNNMWSKSNQLINAGIYDAVSVCGDNINNEKFYVGTWNNGLLEFLKDSLVEHYNNLNSPLQTISKNNWIRIGGLDMDIYNNLWISNSQADTPLVKFDGEMWTNYTIPGLSTNTMIGKVLCTNNDQIWIQLRNDGIMVAKELGGEISSRKIGVTNGLVGQTVNCFVEDHLGTIWIGTSQGLSVAYFTNEIFTNNSYSLESILVETEDGYVERLFENTEILDIKVDGGNRKWVATKNNGVFLMNDDGEQQVKHFTKTNSPLLENRVEEICILPESGEVFFVTANGVCSYRSDASGSVSGNELIKVFPNPVKREYTGLIAISGLHDNTNVKITDISGNLVFETFSLGGTATWDGRNFDGEKVKTGVYLFLCVDEDFDESVVKKVLIYN